MNFLYTGCITRRSTRTIMVLSPLSLTTVPCMIRRGMGKLLRRGRAHALAQDGLDARDVAAHLADARGVLKLARGPAEAQVELLLLQGQELVVELIGGLGAQIGGVWRFCNPLPHRGVKEGF